jgi:hypothetical protein
MTVGRSDDDDDGALPGGPKSSRVVRPMKVVPSFTAAPGTPVWGLGAGEPLGAYDKSRHWRRSGHPIRLDAMLRPRMPMPMNTMDPSPMHPIARQFTGG